MPYSVTPATTDLSAGVGVIAVHEVEIRIIRDAGEKRVADNLS